MGTAEKAGPARAARSDKRACQPRGGWSSSPFRTNDLESVSRRLDGRLDEPRCDVRASVLAAEALQPALDVVLALRLVRRRFAARNCRSRAFHSCARSTAAPSVFTEEFIVVDANGFSLRLIAGQNVICSQVDGVNVLHLDLQTLFQVLATATPVDEFGGRSDVERTAPTLVYASGLTNITWTSATGRFFFDVGGGANPGPAVDVLTLTLTPQSGGDDVITVSATNSIGQPISTEFLFRVAHATSARLAVTKG
jgi:hypothetical protein